MTVVPQNETRWSADDVARAVSAFGPQDLADLRRRLQDHGLTLSQARLPTPIISVVGRSKSGKTTLLEKLIPELKRRGYGVATIKHHAHPGLEIDRPGKDTWRHAQAGSEHVLIAAPDKVASMRRVARALTLDEVAATVRDVDIVLTEGYKRAGKPQVEVVRAARSTEPICEPGNLVALVSDVALSLGVPVFGLEDVVGLADLLEGRFLGKGLMKQQNLKALFVVCIENKDYPASLELRKIYQVIPDARAAKHQHIRVIDESGEDYLYPVDYFVPIEMPQAVEKVFALKEVC